MQSKSNLGKNNFQNYVYGTSNDQMRGSEFHKLIKSKFAQTIEQILLEYGLAEKLQTAKATGQSLQIADVGCGEGLYLIDLANQLKKAGLLAEAELYGFDIDQDAIATAHTLSQQLGLPLHFYIHNALQPLEKSPDMQLIGKQSFDFIFALRLISLTINPRQVVEQLYQSLKPGGVIYLLDLPMHESKEDGWTCPPYLQTLYDQFSAANNSLNQGVEVAPIRQDWLKEFGAERIQTTKDILRAGDGSQESVILLRFLILTIRNAVPILIARGFLTQEQVDKALDITFREMTPNTELQFTVLSTVAQKPLT